MIKITGRWRLLLSGISLLCSEVFAQEQLLPLRYQPALFHHVQPAHTIRSAVALPFIDDFSYPGPDPNPDLWQNSGGNLNYSFPRDPVSYGVLTLDGLKGNGMPYDTISFSFSAIGPADTVTSVPILLGNLSMADSVYLSFYYQPGGIGDIPNTTSFNLFNYGVSFGDSIMLEFKDNTGAWKHAWAHDGAAVQSFKQVMVKITKAAFFHDDFQFRFRNYASIIGNYDQWHIDYVRLNAGRNKSDTLINDVAIQLFPTSILKSYQAMPWHQFEQYKEKEKADEHLLVVKNNFNAVKNTSYHFDAAEKVTGTSVFESVVQSNNISASDTAQVRLATYDIPDFFTDTVIIATRYIVGATGDINTRNDTIIREQVFSNFMAYDDGSAEATYRLLGSPASLAQEYIVNEPDTLQGIEIHFVNTDEDMSQNLFSLIVWSALNDEDTLYRDDFLKPKFTDELNGYKFYRFSRPVIVTDTFYIGFQQSSFAADIKTDIGFDLNTDGSSHLKYNIDSNWIDSQFPGSVMMRPVMGKAIPFQVSAEGPSKHEFPVMIFPNPVNDLLTLRYEGNAVYHCDILDNAGRILLSCNDAKSVVVAQLPPGFYLLKATDMLTGRTVIQKFIKQ